MELQIALLASWSYSSLCLFIGDETSLPSLSIDLDRGCSIGRPRSLFVQSANGLVDDFLAANAPIETPGLEEGGIFPQAGTGVLT